MKTIILTLTLLLGSISTAQAEGDTTLKVSYGVFTKHIGQTHDEGYELNEDNKFLLATLCNKEGFTINFATFDNSYNERSYGFGLGYRFL